MSDQQGDTDQESNGQQQEESHGSAGQQPQIDWKAEARKWESRAKENSGAAKRLHEIEESSKTELQKAQERAESAERRVRAFESQQQIRQWKTEISKTTGVPIEALAGTSKEEIQAHADIIKSLIRPAEATPKGIIGPYVPHEGTGGGVTPPKPDFLRDAYRKSH